MKADGSWEYLSDSGGMMGPTMGESAIGEAQGATGFFMGLHLDSCTDEMVHDALCESLSRLSMRQRTTALVPVLGNPHRRVRRVVSGLACPC